MNHLLGVVPQRSSLGQWVHIEIHRAISLCQTRQAGFLHPYQWPLKRTVFVKVIEKQPLLAVEGTQSTATEADQLKKAQKKTKKLKTAQEAHAIRSSDESMTSWEQFFHVIHGKFVLNPPGLIQSKGPELHGC